MSVGRAGRAILSAQAEIARAGLSMPVVEVDERTYWLAVWDLLPEARQVAPGRIARAIEIAVVDYQGFVDPTPTTEPSVHQIYVTEGQCREFITHGPGGALTIRNHHAPPKSHRWTREPTQAEINGWDGPTTWPPRSGGG